MRKEQSRNQAIKLADVSEPFFNYVTVAQEINRRPRPSVYTLASSTNRSNFTSDIACTLMEWDQRYVSGCDLFSDNMHVCSVYTLEKFSLSEKVVQKHVF